MEEFLTKLKAIAATDRRAVYGEPSVHFARAAKLKEVIAECPDPIMRHGLDQIADKISRLVQTPDYEDGLLDIAGYAMNLYEIIKKRSSWQLDLFEEMQTDAMLGEFNHD